MQIDRYAEVVQRLAKDKADSRFSNKGPEHARVVVEAMFLNASSSVKLYTGCLKKDFYTSEPVLGSLKDFLKRSKGALTILCANNPDSETVSAIRGAPFGGEIRILTMSQDESSGSNNEQHHFMTADGVAYRLEIDDSAREAIVNFNEPSVATALNKWFDSKVSASHSIE